LRVMGIDPGLQVTGWGIIETGNASPAVVEAGVVRTTGSFSLEERLNQLYSGVRELITAHQPGLVAVEDLYSHYKHPTTAILMGHARGVIFLAASEASIPVKAYSATRIKKCITGNGRAAKRQMQRMVTACLSLQSVPEPPDVCDALAAALTCMNESLGRRPA